MSSRIKRKEKATAEQITFDYLEWVKEAPKKQSYNELFVDLFAGGGGASEGAERALGRPVDLCVNHDPMAIAIHRVNHPNTTHLIEDVFDVNPLTVTLGKTVAGLWASPPDCTHFSKAKGGTPKDKKNTRFSMGCT